MVYAATTGGTAIDLFVSDRVATPPELHASTLVEKLLTLPEGPDASRLVRSSDAPRVLAAKSGLPPRLLQCLLQARQNILKAAEQKNISRARIIFMNRTASLSDHIRRTSLSDVYLDTRLYNAHTIAVDVLWSGVPLVAMPGTSLAARVTVARTKQDYIDVTKALVRTRGAARNALARKAFQGLRNYSEIFDGDLFARKLEKGFLIALRTIEHDKMSLSPNCQVVPPKLCRCPGPAAGSDIAKKTKIQDLLHRT
eukprot:38771-Hanusia_phi.AAC.1